jgi:hypothetical protein
MLTTIQSRTCCLIVCCLFTKLPVVLYRRETSSLILREVRLRVFHNRAQRRIFGPKRDEVTGRWKKLYHEEFHDMCSSPNIMKMMKCRRMRWAERVT